MKELIMKPCPSYPNYYADNYGNIYSSQTTNRYDRTTLKQLKRINCCLNKPKQKYMATVIVMGKRLYTSRASLVLDAFVSQRPHGMYACHGTLGSTVDSLENLTWGTPRQNQLDRLRDGTDSLGEKNGFSKLTEQQVVEIRANIRGLPYTEFAKKFNVSKSTITNVANRYTWKHI